MIVLAEKEQSKIGFQKSNHKFTFLHWGGGPTMTKFKLITWSYGLERDYIPLAPTLFVEWRDED
jgi:hypothetical protein